MSEWGIFSLAIGAIVGGGLVIRQVWIDSRTGLQRPRAWLSWIGGLAIGLTLAALMFLRADK